MKAFKLFLAVIIASFGFVSCKKSTIRPGNVDKTTTETIIQEESPNGRFRGTVVTSSEDGNQIVGGGDDDRDGGDKKKTAGR